MDNVQLSDFQMATARVRWRVDIAAFAAALALLVVLCAPAQIICRQAAWADVADKPSVLILESGLGDYELCKLHWLGNDVQDVAQSGDFTLATVQNAVWWASAGAEGDAPTTFLLGSKAGKPSLNADNIVWALDHIRESGAQPKAFVVAMGLTGLPLREYVQGASQDNYDTRADIVGVAFCGTPNSGYSAIDLYPENGLWDVLAASVGKTQDEIAAGSDYIEGLNAGSMPRVTKNLLACGAVGDLGFGSTDGAGIASDYSLLETVSNQVATERVSATVGQNAKLTDAWSPLASRIDYGNRAVDPALAERLAAMSCYETSDEVVEKVASFYSAWFGASVPVTHNSTALLFDLSGSMLERVEGAASKLDAVKEAAKEYLQAVRACDSIPLSAPTDVTVFGFSEFVEKVAAGFDEDAAEATESMRAHGETDIGLALDEALAHLESSPICANKRVLLLSDGASTQGKSNSQILEDAVAAAEEDGVCIDTVGFGESGESDAGFLKKLAKRAGGEYYQASDLYDLKMSFLKSRYAALGLEYSDIKIGKGQDAAENFITADATTGALDMSVVSEGGLSKFKLLCDGRAVDESNYTLSSNGNFVSLQYTDPPAGSYSLSFAGVSTRAHAFAAKYPGISSEVIAERQQADYSSLMLAGAAFLLAAAVAVAVVRSRRKPVKG